MTLKVKTELKELISRRPNARGQLTLDSEYANQHVTVLVAPAQEEPNSEEKHL